MSGAGAADDSGDGRRHDDDLPPVDVVVPDDARELDADLLAYLRDVRRTRLRARIRRLLLTGRWEELGLSGPLVVVGLAAVAVLGSLAWLPHPGVEPRPAPLPLASTDERPGDPGALLPDVTLTVRGTPRPARALRPAVVAIVPQPCDCLRALVALDAQAGSYGLRMVLVVRPSDIRHDGALVAVTGGTAALAVDAGQQLSAAYAARGLTVVLVHRDGIVEDVVRDVGSDIRLERELAVLSRPGAP